jgi:hypothetical protein
MLTCLLELQQFWKQKEGGQILERFIDTAQRIKSMYISNFEMVCLAIYI